MAKSGFLLFAATVLLAVTFHQGELQRMTVIITTVRQKMETQQFFSHH